MIHKKKDREGSIKNSKYSYMIVQVRMRHVIELVVTSGAKWFSPHDYQSLNIYNQGFLSLDHERFLDYQGLKIRRDENASQT